MKQYGFSHNPQSVSPISLLHEYGTFVTSEIEDYDFYNDTFGDYGDYSKYYKIDVFEKDGSFLKTIETGVPLKSYWNGKTHNFR